jgi:hypothetical protein
VRPVEVPEPFASWAMRCDLILRISKLHNGNLPYDELPDGVVGWLAPPDPVA